MVVVTMIVVVIMVIMTAMFVMHVTFMAMRRMIVLRMVVLRVVMLGMIVAMMTVIVMRVAVAMIVPVTSGFMRSGIGAAFGIEWRLDLDHLRAEPLHHLLDHMVAANAQAAGGDLRRQMAIAEMPGQPHQMAGIGAADLDQRLWCCDDLDEAAVFQHQGIAAAQGDGVFQIEQEFQSARPRHRHAATMAVVEVEDDGVRRRLCPVVLAFD